MLAINCGALEFPKRIIGFGPYEVFDGRIRPEEGGEVQEIW